MVCTYMRSEEIFHFSGFQHMGKDLNMEILIASIEISSASRAHPQDLDNSTVVASPVASSLAQAQTRSLKSQILSLLLEILRIAHEQIHTYKPSQK